MLFKSTKLTKLRLIPCFGLLVLVLSFVCIINPQKALAAKLYVSSSVPPNEAAYVIVNVNIDVSNSSPGPNAFQGDKITQNGNNYYITNGGGKQLYQIPSTINLAIVDVGSGNQLGTYCNTNAAGNYLPCGGDSIDPQSPFKISASGVIQYSAYFAWTDELGAPNASKITNKFVACPSGTNISTEPACHTNSSSLNDWSVESCALPTGISGSCNATTKLNNVSLSLPLPSDYEAPAPPAGSSGTGGTTGSSPATCDASGGFAWFTCAAAELLAKTEASLEQDVITPLLQTRPINFSAPSSCANDSVVYNANNNTTGTTACKGNDVLSAIMYNVWSNFRIYGNIVLVIALLALVFGEVIGGGIIDAYTVKKMLPRILIAAILINLSIYIIAALYDVANIVGAGLQSLVQQPFGGTGLQQNASTGSTIPIQVGGGAGGVFDLGLVGLVGAIGFTEGIAGVLLAVVGIGLLAAIGVLLTLLFRQGLLVLLLVVSPVAFALYCLPNTEQYFRKWWGLLIKTLMVYPIISLIFAICNISAIVMGGIIGPSETGVSNLLSQMFGVLALIMPLFLIPFAFKMAGGAIGSISGAISNASNKLKEPINNMRNANRENRLNRARAGNLFRGNNRLARFNSDLAQGVMMAPKAGLNPRNWRAKMHEARGASSLERANEMMEKSPEFAGMVQDDTMLRATRALAAGDEDEARRILRADGLRRFNSDRELANGLAQAQSVQRAGGARAVQVATTMALGGINSGFDGRVDERGNAIDSSQAMMAEIVQASGGDAVLGNQMMGRMKGMRMQAGHVEDGGASFGGLSAQFRNAYGAQAAGGGYGAIARSVDSDALHLDAFENNDAVTVSRAQVPGLQGMVQAAQNRLNTLDSEMRSGRTLTEEEHTERGRLAANLEKLQSTASMYAAPTRTEVIQQALDETAGSRGQVKYADNGQGEAVDIGTRQVVPVSHRDAQVPPEVRGYREQAPTRGYNPNDPNAQGP